MRIGVDPLPLEPWMEELYRRVSDRQTMGSVVDELRAGSRCIKTLAVRECSRRRRARLVS